MRQLIIQVPRGKGDQVIEIAQSFDAVNVAQFQGRDSKQPVDLVLVYVTNDVVTEFLEKLDAEVSADASLALLPHEVLTLLPPTSRAAKPIRNLAPRSPLEIFLQGIQSVSSWPSFLGYAVAGAIVVWIGLFTNSVYLLIAAMLIAPFAGPAMHIALATAVGDRLLFTQNLARYGAAIATTVAVAALLSWIFGQETMTGLMASVSQVSEAAVLLPLIAGGAGGLNLVQPEQGSLVSGSAVGILVAASLAPPAGLIGMALTMGRWNVVLNALFVLILQLVGINLSGSILFRIYGLTPKLVRYQRGQRWVFYASIAVTLVALIGLLSWQFSGEIRLQRSSQGTRAAQAAQEVINESRLGTPVSVEAEFSNLHARSEATLLVRAYVQQPITSTVSNERVAQLLEIQIQRRLEQQNTEVIPLVDVTVLRAP